jgi:hypothetical protein
MKFRTVVWATALLAVFVMTAAAADVSGKWTAQVPGRGGETRETTFNFKADGSKLTGTMTGMQGDLQIADGKVMGDEISFTVNVNFNGNEMKMMYKGKVSGGEIKFTRTREGSDRTAEFTAKKPVT